jgi:hypothetical protein
LEDERLFEREQKERAQLEARNYEEMLQQERSDRARENKDRLGGGSPFQSAPPP